MGWKHKGLSLMREAGYLPVTIACSGNQGSSRDKDLVPIVVKPGGTA